MDRRGVRRFGHPLEPPSKAVTVRVRSGETLVADGPFIETKEHMAGFDVIECADLDEAIEVAAAHPVSWFHRVEVRPFADRPLGQGGSPTSVEPPAKVPLSELGSPAPGRQRYLLLACVDGMPEADEVGTAIQDDAVGWLAQTTARGARVYGHALKHAETATTVRVRNGETLISDGPFVETKEFVGGFDVVDCVSREEAIELASRHPLARHHMIEVRPFRIGE